MRKLEDDSPILSDELEYHDEETLNEWTSQDDSEEQEEAPVKRKRQKRKKSTIIHEGSDKPLATKDRHYVSNKDFYEAMKERRKLVLEALAEGKPKPKISNYIGECILQIANNLGKKKNFTRYSYKDEMVSDAVTICINYLDNFNPDLSTNPFSYFTQCCNYAFINRISAEKQHQYVKYRSTLNSITQGNLACVDDDMDNGHLFDNVKIETEFMTEFVEEFERKKKKVELVEKPKEGLEAFF